MKSVTVKQIQKLDDVAINKFGVPSLALMENAGRSVAQEVLKKIKRIKGKRICIICGRGNNAGDGFVVARHLINAGIKIEIFLIGRAYQLKNDALVNFKILNNLKVTIKQIDRHNRLIEQAIKRADIVVDAIFGVGLNRELKDPFKSIIEAINSNAKCVIAVDIPSGLDGTTGKIYGVCVKSSTTVTFSFVKKGFLKNQGPQHVGKIVVVDIGIPVQLMRKL